LLFALRLTLELPKASETTPLAQKRRIYVLPSFNLPCRHTVHIAHHYLEKPTLYTDAAVRGTVGTVRYR